MITDYNAKRAAEMIVQDLLVLQFDVKREGRDMDAAKISQAIALIKQATGLTDEISGQDT